MKKTLIPLLFLFSVNIAQAQNYNLIIGTYTNKGNSEGIYVYDYNTITAETKLKSTTKTINPSYLAISKDKKFIYSVNEDGKNSTISSFSFNSQSGNLSFLDKKDSEGADPCFITTNGNQILVANYSGGSLATFYTDIQGKFLKPKQVLQHTGKSIDTKRQLSAHVHQVQVTPDKKYLIATDLGEDQIYIYKIAKTHARELTLKSVIKTTPGSGPRHLAFTPNGKFAYLAHEFTGTITTFSYAKGDLHKLQEINTVAKDFDGKIDGADIHVTPDGKFLYETNRGDSNSISLFAIATDGTLTFIETVSTLGKGPRNFSIDPSGDFLLVAHQYTNDVVIFKRDKTTGKLIDSGIRISVGTPVCLLFSK
ncbi:lactonase family protein [Pedobacter frigiditerrae]|uniref:lactonase family protein n=1 Tax=Pedobacter frigiditerrae TaxID=2530452 RepID=UPI0029306B2E|nr:lactonase family protein [Pedobacter frigiditerrae]